MRNGVFFLLLASCTVSSAPISDAGKDVTNDQQASDATVSGPLACYVMAENVCDEYIDPTPQQAMDVPLSCSNRMGVLSKPPACPKAGFVGKCTIGTGKGAYVQRWYAPTDAMTFKSSCEGFMMGTWSMTF